MELLQRSVFALHVVQIKLVFCNELDFECTLV